MIPCRIWVDEAWAPQEGKRTDDRHLVLAKMAPRVFNVDSGWIKKRDFKKIHVIGHSCVYGALHQADPNSLSTMLVCTPNPFMAPCPPVKCRSGRSNCWPQPMTAAHPTAGPPPERSPVHRIHRRFRLA